jgi:ComF family protein
MVWVVMAIWIGVDGTMHYEGDFLPSPILGYHETEAAHHPRKGDSLSIFHGACLNIGAFIRQLSPAQPCVLCGRMSHDGLWCAACDRTLPYLPAAHCPSCALPTPAGEICGHCLRHPPLFDRATAAFAYAYPLDRLVQAMKYREQLALVNAFAGKLVQQIDRSSLPDRVIAMPLHPAKLRERGFNQSLLLAAATARSLKIELLPHACRRVRDTPPQSALPFKERKKNVRDAFCCDIDLSGRHVALVDDVLTTGASLNALAAAVKKRGATEISVWVAARTLPHAPIRQASRNQM